MRLTYFILLLLLPTSVLADEETDSTKERRTLSTVLRPVLNIADAVTNFFMGCDTNYVTPQKYEFTAIHSGDLKNPRTYVIILRI